MLSKSISAILLSLCFLLNSAQGSNIAEENVQQGDGSLERIVIGYRTVNTPEAQFINTYNIPYRGKWVDDARGKINQLGNGLHLTQIPGYWPDGA
ncbi:hypothetical protein LZ554_003584 [Drepanopeziza brunnea f. sp. 'monogermtubi']|nr:hypothetical protein LZ554_003584 [Drepanopeziza brunnea f. sp. 'monogermtubi']